MIFHQSHERKRRCMKFAKGCVQSYAEKKKLRSQALAGSYLGHDRADLSVEVQYTGRLGECGVCDYLHIDIEVLDWNTERCDNGIDILHNGWRIDVKSSATHGATCLIWPLEKKLLLADAPIDLLVFVPIDRIYNQPDVRAWISKQDFIEWHNVAGRFGKLHPGTWFMEESELHLIKDEALPALKRKKS